MRAGFQDKTVPSQCPHVVEWASSSPWSLPLMHSLRSTTSQCHHLGISLTHVGSRRHRYSAHSPGKMLGGGSSGSWKDSPGFQEKPYYEVWVLPRGRQERVREKASPRTEGETPRVGVRSLLLLLIGSQLRKRGMLGGHKIAKIVPNFLVLPWEQKVEVLFLESHLPPPPWFQTCIVYWLALDMRSPGACWPVNTSTFE